MGLMDFFVGKPPQPGPRAGDVAGLLQDLVYQNMPQGAAMGVGTGPATLTPYMLGGQSAMQPETVDPLMLQFEQRKIPMSEQLMVLAQQNRNVLLSGGPEGEEQWEVLRRMAMTEQAGN